MEKTERGYFEAVPSDNGGRESYESLFAMDPTLFTPSAFINAHPNTNEDLNDILSGSNFMGEFEYVSGLDAGYNAWGSHNQGTTYSLHPNLALDQQQYGAGLSSRSIASDFEQGFADNNDGEIQAIPYSDIHTSSQIGSHKAKTTTAALGQSTKPAKSVVSKKSAATAGATDDTPKGKKTRGRRKTKEKSAEEKKAKEERKLERNRMAASKCRQKKKLATEEMMENFNELERQNQFMKAYLEEVKQERNKVLALLFEHKPCGHLGIEKCLESQLERITEEFEYPQRTDTIMLGAHSLENQTNTDAEQFLNSNPTSPSDMQSRRNSISIDAIAMSRSSSNMSPHATPLVTTKHSVQPQSSHASQVWDQQFPSGYQSWQEQFSTPQGSQGGSRPGSKTSHQHYINSPTSSGSSEDSMSRQNSSRNSVFEEHGDTQTNDSGISNVDTPPEERKKRMPDGPEDEAISLVAQETAIQSRPPHMLRNQRLIGNPNIHPAMQPLFDLKDPAAFIASLTRTSL